MENENQNLNENIEPTVEQVEQNTQSTNKQPKGEGFFKKIINWVKSHTKLLAIIVAVIVVAIIAIVIVTSLIGSPKKAVKKYISAYSSMNGNKIVAAMDIKGAYAYKKSSSSSYFSSSLDGSKFKDAYNDVSKDDVKDLKEDLIDSFKDLKKEAKKENALSIKLIRIKDTEKVEDCDDLYTVTAKVRISFKDDDGDKQDVAQTMKFYVYKNKVVASDFSGLTSLVDFD